MYSREATNEQQQQLKQPLCAAKEINRMATMLREYHDSTATPDSSSETDFTMYVPKKWEHTTF